MNAKELSRYFAKIGSVGGRAAAKRMSKAARIERARKAGQSRRKKGGKV